MIISRFSGDYEFLSNFYPCIIKCQGVSFRSVEAAYQASKTLNIRTRKTFTCMNASQSKQAGRRLVLRPDWEQVKVRIMYQLLLQKFCEEGPNCFWPNKLGKQLMATGDAILIEGNTWGDRYWGQVNGEGENHLGKLLMNVRINLLIPF